MKPKIHIPFFCCLLLSLPFFISCVKDKPVVQSSAPLTLSIAKKVYVINEGNFGSGNSSVSLYDASTNNVLPDFYFSQNNAHAGDVAQCLNFINGNFYIVVNNSGKILVCDKNLKKTTQITGLSSPRYIQKVSNSKAYVSDLKANKMAVVDLNSNSVTGYIPCNGWTERMTMLYNKVYVTNMRSNYVYQINAVTDKIEDSIYVGVNAGSLVIDKYDALWVLSSGDVTKNVLPRLSKINTTNNAVILFWEFASGDSPFDLNANAGSDTLYFINGGIFRMKISDTALPLVAWVQSEKRNFYGLGVNPNDYSIYAADALDYVQNSNVYVFDVNGNQKNIFKAGINVNGFWFEE